MNGLGGLNKSPEGVVIGLVQLQLPNVVTRADLAKQTERIVWMVGKARRNLSTMDLVVFPEYSLHGLTMDTNPEIMCRLDGPEVAAFKQACIDNRIWGCFSIMEFNPHGNPYNSGLIIDDHGDIKLYYRNLHPWNPVEPWERLVVIEDALELQLERDPDRHPDVVELETREANIEGAGEITMRELARHALAAEQADRFGRVWGGDDHEVAGRQQVRQTLDRPQGLDAGLRLGLHRVHGQDAHAECQTAAGASLEPIHARAAIVTVPLALLKAKRLRFRPDLKDKESTIEKLEAGRVKGRGIGGSDTAIQKNQREIVELDAAIARCREKSRRW